MLRETSDSQYNCSTPADQCNAHPCAVISPFQPIPTVYAISVRFNGMEYHSYGHFRSDVLPVLCQLLLHLLTGRALETEKSEFK